MIKVIIHFNNGNTIEYETKTSKDLLCKRFNINYFNNNNNDNTQALIVGNKTILINKSNINYIEFEE